MGFFGWMLNLKQYRPKLGDAVTVIWENDNEQTCGGTEGFVLGVVGDDASGEHLVIDRKTNQDSFKSKLFLLGLLDLQVIPMKNVESITKTEMRKRPPGSIENFSMKVEANYMYNIDFDATREKLWACTDCNVKLIRKSKSEAEYGISIKKIETIEGSSITISAKGAIQVFCKHDRLFDCIKWLHKTVKLLPGQERFVLFPTKITYRINDTIKEKARPTEEAINRVGRMKGPPLVILPIGWSHRYFVKLPENPFQKLFPDCQPLEKFVIKAEDRKNSTLQFPVAGNERGSEQVIELKTSRPVGTVMQHLGAYSPLIRVHNKMENSPKYEDYLIKLWLEMRSAPWQWFSSDQIKDKMIVGDLNIDKKSRIWTLDFHEYSSIC